MTNPHYELPKIWTWEQQEKEDHAGKFSSINRPTAGARFEHILPKGDKPFQLYSLNTPNGIKINIILEELAELNITEAGYDAFQIHIGEGDQFGSGFVDLNPNSKIPALLDQSVAPNVKVFESGSILLYLAEKFDCFIPKNSVQQKTDCLNWLMWQMGSAPYLGGGFGHFYKYVSTPMEYPINRFTMEVKRQLDVLNQHLQNNTHMCGDDYSIADMAIWPWYGRLALGTQYDAGDFLQVQQYTHVVRWAKLIEQRPAVQRAINLELTPINT